jgi:hypothetical protein
MIHHIAITSNIPERLSQFYEELPGLMKIQENRENGIIRSVWFAIHNSKSILMIERGENKAPYTLVFDLLYFFSVNKNKIISEMKNIIPLVESKTEFTFYFRDPDGNRLGYSSYPEKLSDYMTFL